MCQRGRHWNPSTRASRPAGAIAYHGGVDAWTRRLPIALATPDDLPAAPLYVFGYGSLLWRPGFAYSWCAKGRIHGFHRALRVWSFHHRGSEARPGLVLGLDAGGSCHGCIFRVEAEQSRDVAAYLWAREMVTSVYRPRLMAAHSDSGERLAVLTFVLDRRHRQYAGPLDVDEAAGHIRGAAGKSGPNEEYVRETVARLAALGLRDGHLEQVVGALNARATSL